MAAILMKLSTDELTDLHRALALRNHEMVREATNHDDMLVREYAARESTRMVKMLERVESELYAIDKHEQNARAAMRLR